MKTYRVAIAQTNSSPDKEANVAAASRLVERAAAMGARLVALPELFNCLGHPDEMVRQAEPIPGPTTDAMAQLAARLEITLLAGSIAERSDSSGKVFNTSTLFAPDGRLLARYRKMHLFEVDLPGRVTFQESRWMIAGDETAVVATPLGRLGLATCYDLRFPELFRRLADEQADVFLIPSAFTETTGRDHWEVLVRARAIENQVYVVAPNQYGVHGPKMRSYGRSMIVDPWGTPLAIAPDGEGVVLAEIDLLRLEAIRRELPALANRRLSR